MKVKKIILKIYNLRCVHCINKIKRNIKGMEKHVLDRNNSKFKKYSSECYKYEVRLKHIEKKRNKFLKTWF